MTPEHSLAYVRCIEGMWTLFNHKGLVLASSPQRSEPFYRAAELDLTVMLRN